MNNSYAKSYTEVLEILKYIPKSDYEKIPKKEIEFYKNNCDKEYQFSINENLPLNEQNISKKTNAVLVSIFKNYIATEIQKEKLKVILKDNLYQDEQIKQKKYDVNNIFFKKEQIKKDTYDANNIFPKKEQIKQKTYDVNNIFSKKKQKKEYEDVNTLVPYKENIFIKIFNKIKSIFKRH